MTMPYDRIWSAAVRSKASKAGLPAAAGLAALIIGRAVAVDPYRIAAETGLTVLGAAAIWTPRLLAASTPAVMLLLVPLLSGPPVGLVLPLVLLLAVVVRKVVASSVPWSLGRSALCAFAAWIVLNLLFHYGGLGELGPTTVSPFADASTLLAGLMLALAASWLNIPRGYLFLVTGLAIAAAAVVTIVAGSPDAVLLGLNRNYLGLVMAIGLAIGCTALNRRSAAAWLPLLVAMIWALMILQSRGAIVAVGCGAALAGLMRLTRQFGPRLMPIGLTILVLVVGGIATSPALSQAVQFGRSEPDLASSDAARFATTDLAVATTMANPVLGIGYGRFPIVADRDPRLNFFINTHNDFLRLAAELGLPGLGLFLLIVYSSATGLRRSRERAGLVVVATYLVGLLFANTLSNLAVTTPFWLCLGIGLRVARSDETAMAAENPELEDADA